MRVYEMAAVKDCGKYYDVEYLTSSLMRDFEKSGKFIGLSISAANTIREAIEKGKRITIIANYQDIDVQVHDLTIHENNTDELQFDKDVLIQTARQYVTHQQANVSGLMMFEYININNYLSDKGYFIHDDNREEVYLNILETGDELLINKLEIYLNARDNIARSSYMENEYFKLYQDIRESTSTEEAQEVFDKFMDQLVK